MDSHPLDGFFEDETIRAALVDHYRRLQNKMNESIPEFSKNFTVSEIEKFFEIIGPEAVENLVDKFVPSGLIEKHGTTLEEIKKRGRKRKFGLAAHLFRLSILSAVVGGSFVGTDDSPRRPFDVGSSAEDYNKIGDELRLQSAIEEGRVANPGTVLRASDPETEVSSNSTRVVASPGYAFEGFNVDAVSYNETLRDDDYYDENTEEIGAKLARRPIYNRTAGEYFQSWERDGKAIYARASSLANSALRSLNLRRPTEEEFLDEVNRIEAETSEGGFRVSLNDTETETQESNLTNPSSRSAPADQEVTPRRQRKDQRGSYFRKKSSPVLSRAGGVFDWAFGSGASADPPKPPDEIKVNADAPGKRRIVPLPKEEFDALFNDLDMRGQSQGWGQLERDGSRSASRRGAPFDAETTRLSFEDEPKRDGSRSFAGGRPPRSNLPESEFNAEVNRINNREDQAGFRYSLSAAKKNPQEQGLDLRRVQQSEGRGGYLKRGISAEESNLDAYLRGGKG